MESIREQMDLSNEISDAISNPVNMGIEVDDVSFDFQLPRETVPGGPAV
jgi:charged multivesicular body protein 4